MWIWDILTGTPRAVLVGHVDLVQAIAIAPNGTWLASAGEDGTVRIWDVATWTERAVLTGHTGSVTAIAVSHDGIWLASTSADKTIRIWNVDTGQATATMRVDRVPMACAWLPDNQSLIVGGHAGLYMFQYLQRQTSHALQATEDRD